MKKHEINIRDPFILCENGAYYLYGTRAADFGCKVGGFDVYISDNLEDWDGPFECFNSSDYNMNTMVNWAPEVHKYNGEYYMLATFTKENGLRGTFALKANNPKGPFVPHSETALTPWEWECLDGTLYLNKEGRPFLVFCHEHTQIVDGTICFMELSSDLKKTVGEVTTLFSASEPSWADKKPKGEHYVTDGPFMYRSKSGDLFMLWSTFINHKYSQCLVRFENQEIGTQFNHLEPVLKNDGGHGMVFAFGDKKVLTFHSPNETGKERPVFKELIDNGNSLSIADL